MPLKLRSLMSLLGLVAAISVCPPDSGPSATGGADGGAQVQVDAGKAGNAFDDATWDDAQWQ